MNKNSKNRQTLQLRQSITIEKNFIIIVFIVPSLFVTIFFLEQSARPLLTQNLLLERTKERKNERKKERKKEGKKERDRE